ncbi:RNA polymerase sigma factor, sigma-70 family protein [[Clostridium] bifermentans ATCC 19299]|uniref:sigma-70 family RNA polymerase sigma factor n=1 Tax=Paraclostridium bifermentans TaxID=1490 RepID=UPI00038CEE4F|nr:sigma-70 family RNA polymerase sigma factor [Paraclostridium bifermentans]EQK46971.1 RNA polymerase sigma factor, sigma-70 family protein [[Clostridium] bifermentans ATCC 19299] [Paraclostridium bifermentans ATCC 19299]
MKTKEELLVEENIKLVHFVINKRYKTIIQKINYLGLYEDFYQEGCIGLFKAVKAFDESKGFKFSTFGFRWIDLQLRSFVGKYMPKHYNDNLVSMDKKINKGDKREITLKDAIYSYDEYNGLYSDLKKFAKTTKIKDIDTIIDLSLEGLSQREISTVIGISQPEVSRRVKRFKTEFEIYSSLGELVRINKVS